MDGHKKMEGHENGGHKIAWLKVTQYQQRTPSLSRQHIL